MPPRMVMALDGVVIVTAFFLLMLPPTKRNTPRVALNDNSPSLWSAS